MIKRIASIGTLFVLLAAVFISSLPSQPSLNGPTPGCGSAGSCHSQQSGIISAIPSGLQVQITLSGTTGNVAGELVDSTGTVVALNNGTSSNPFTLTAPGPGRYTVNGGFKNPSRQWGTTQVDLVLTGVEEGPGAHPGGFRLEQNYPNPFNPSTTVAYTLPERTHVSLRVYDMSGREVAALVDGVEGPGSKTVDFNATGLASGAYLYRLVAGGRSESKHFLLVR